MYYVLFIIKCLFTKFNFFRLTSNEKALVLKRNHLYFASGLLYMKNKSYQKAIYCLEKAHAFKQLMVCYEKLGATSCAIGLAEEHGYYKQGALICMKHHNKKKAAYFYSFTKPLYAAKLYKECDCYYEAGIAYMKTYQFLQAIECFYKATDPLQKLDGLRQIEEVAIVLYLSKQYEDSLKLFEALGDYYSVLECAKRCKNTELVRRLQELIATYEAHENNYLTAAHYIASLNMDRARLYYYLDQSSNDALKLAIDKGNYFSALKICFNTNNLPLAKQVAKLYA
jgi:tetratricopeptide (TPR) repeat protein